MKKKHQHVGPHGHLTNIYEKINSDHPKKKPGQVSKVDVDLNPGPEAGLLPNIPPPSAHPHLSHFYQHGSFNVYPPQLSGPGEAKAGRSSREPRLARCCWCTLALLLLPSWLHTSRCCLSGFTRVFPVSWRTKFCTCLYPWITHLTAVPLPQFTLSTMVGRSSLTSNLPDQSRPGQAKIYLTFWLSDDYPKQSKSMTHDSLIARGTTDPYYRQWNIIIYHWMVSSSAKPILLLIWNIPQVYWCIVLLALPLIIHPNYYSMLLINGLSKWKWPIPTCLNWYSYQFDIDSGCSVLNKR